jgi:hypothetical protein
MSTSEGRTLDPSARLCFMPRMRPVIPATRMIAPPPDAAPRSGGEIVGSTISFAVHPMKTQAQVTANCGFVTCILLGNVAECSYISNVIREKFVDDFHWEWGNTTQRVLFQSML